MSAASADRMPDSGHSGGDVHRLAADARGGASDDRALERADEAELDGFLTDGGGSWLGKRVIVIGRGAHGRYLEQSRL